MRRFASAATAVSALALLVACSPSGDGSGASSGAGGQVLSANSPEALSLFSLDQSGAGRVAFTAARADGRATVFDGVSITVTGEDGETGLITSESLRLEGASSGADGAGFKTATFTDLTIIGEDSDAAISIGSLVVDAPNAAAASLMAQMFSAEGVPEDFDAGDLADYALGAITLSDISIAALPEDGDAQLAAFSIDQISMSDLANARVGELLLSGLAMSGLDEDGRPFSFALDRTTLNGLDLAFVDVLDALSGAGGPENFGAEALEAAIVETGFADPYAKRYDTMALDGLTLDIDGVNVAVNDASAVMSQTRGGVVQESTLGAIAVTFDPQGELGGQAAAALSAFGFSDGLRFSGSSRQIADPFNDLLTVQKNEFILEDGFTMNTTMQVEGMAEYARRAAALALAQSAAQAEAEAGGDGAAYGGQSLSDMDALDAEMQQLLEPLSVHAFELRLEDNSLVERVLAGSAAMTGMTVEDLRSQAGMFLSMGVMMAPQGAMQAAAQQAVGALQGFISDPGTLVVRLDSDAPVAVSDLTAALEGDAAGAPLPISFTHEPK